MKNLVLLLSFALLAGCRQQQPLSSAPSNAESSRARQAHAQRFLPVGNNPEIALDSQDGTLCRTVPAAGREPGCAVSEEDKKLGFVPASCKGGQTWIKAVKGGSAEEDLREIMRVRDELRKAGDSRADTIDRLIERVKGIKVEPDSANLPLCSARSNFGTGQAAPTGGVKQTFSEWEKSQPKQ
ncbi:MAG TPA: hypothetical protein VKM93_06945 [Terriglobia bacterium]|nr:hypothetical protein [Terriglobia bacterium]